MNAAGEAESAIVRGCAPPVFVNRVRAEAMLVCASLLGFGMSHYAVVAIDDGSAESIISCIKTMNGEMNGDIWLDSSREAFHQVIGVSEARKKSAALEKAMKDQTPVEEVSDRLPPAPISSHDHGY